MKIEQARFLYRSGFQCASQLTEIVGYLSESDIEASKSKKLRISLARIIADIELEFGREVKEGFPEIQKEIDKELRDNGCLKE